MKNRLLTIAVAAAAAVSPLAAQQQQTVELPDPIRVGSYEVWIMQESGGEGNTGALIEPPAEVLQRYAPEGTYPTATHIVLIRRGGKVWLVDAGFGLKIVDQMAALGIAPEDVDEVLVTHMHGDHIGGLVRDGARAFPNATVSLAGLEFEYWKGSRNRMAQGVLTAYDGSFQMLSPVEIDSSMPEGTITPVAAYGHTPGHTLFMIRDGGEQLLIWGDLTHAMAVQMPHPEISVTYDVDPDMARESRMKVLRHVAAEGIPVVGMHIPLTRAGEVVRNGSGYEFRAR